MPQVIASPADWRASDLAANTDWIAHFSPDECAEIDAALRVAQARGATLETLTRDDFPLPRVGTRIAELREHIENGRGIRVLRGLPTAPYTKDELRLIYWGLGRHIGTAVSQSKDGDLLGDVRNFGADVFGAEGRGYKSKQQLSFHTDSCDVVALMVLRIAMSGGISMVASSVAVHNEMVRRRPDLAAALYEPVAWSWQGQEPAGDPGWYLQPIFNFFAGKFSCRYVRAHVRNAQSFDDAPRLSGAQAEALDLLDEIAWREDVHLAMHFEPGDIQVLCNHTCMHSRTAFEDFPEEDRRRHLLRMWLSVPNSRALSPQMATIFRDTSPGAVRGGFPSRTGAHRYDTAGVLAD
jgi:Taurine catabolism dioxygenase TauD, TfdA family